jgi:hypothetical protein
MSDAACGVAGKMSVREKNERCSEWCGGQDVDKGRKRGMQRAARRARPQRENETSDAASGVVGKTSTREKKRAMQ